MKAFAASLALLIGTVGCKSRTSESDPKLVNGIAASEGQFPGVLKIVGSCTAAKVGPRHILLAAHCVYATHFNDTPPYYQPGATVRFSQKLVLDALKSAPDDLTATVKNTFVHPSYFAAGGLPNTYPRVFEEPYPSDVAVIELVEEIPAVAQLPISTEPVAVGSTVTILGYGCEHGVFGKYSSTATLKYREEKTLDESALDHKGSFNDATTAPKIRAGYLITPGFNHDDQSSSICPGDSGGPVLLRQESGGFAVVGVNSYYSFLPREDDPEQTSVTNWHARLDTDSKQGIGTWLAAVFAGKAEANVRNPARANLVDLTKASAPASAVIAGPRQAVVLTINKPAGALVIRSSFKIGVKFDRHQAGKVAPADYQEGEEVPGRPGEYVTILRLKAGTFPLEFKAVDAADSGPFRFNVQPDSVNLDF